MIFIVYAFQIGIVFVCLIGLGLAGKRLLPQLPFELHFCFLPLALLLFLCFFEHIIGLGNMPWLWIPMSLGSVWLIKTASWSNIKLSIFFYFLAGFSMSFLWCFSEPDFSPKSDTMLDLSLLECGSLGKTLPMDDMWIRGFKLDTYYMFQFYCGGWIHRAFGCSYGLTYILSCGLISGYTTAAIGAGIRHFTSSRFLAGFLVLSYILGGNGASIFTPWMDVYPPTYTSCVRFIDSYATPTLGNQPPDHITPFGHWFVHFIGTSPVEAPMAYPSYCMLLKDFHPPLSTFLVLSFSMLALAFAEKARPGCLEDHVCLAMIIAAPFILFISNPWVFPLQGIFTVSYIAYRWWFTSPIPWRGIVAYFAGSSLLIFPDFWAYNTSYHLSQGIARDTIIPPLLNWITVMLPAFVCGAFMLFHLKHVRLASLIIFVGGLTAVLSYVGRVKDYGGEEELYNTTLKMWPWVYQFLVVGGVMCLWQAKRFRFLRYIALIPLVLSLLGNGYIFKDYFVHADKQHMGRLEGTSWYASDPSARAIFEMLSCLPRGVLIESDVELGSPALVLSTLTANYSLCGAPWEEVQKRENRDDLFTMERDIKHFYAGELTDPDSWLTAVTAGGVTYVAWQARDNQKNPGGWAKVNTQLAEDYLWNSVSSDPQNPIGFWVRKGPPPKL